MDIFRFIDSADIRRYLAEIRYRFSTEEKMFLIWYCKAATLNEKIAAWQEIVGMCRVVLGTTLWISESG